MKSFSNIGNTTRYVLATFLAAAAFTMAAMPNKAFAQSTTSVAEAPVNTAAVNDETDKALSKEEIIKYVIDNSIQYPSSLGIGICHMNFPSKEEGKVDFYCNRVYEKGNWEITENAKGQAVMVRTFSGLKFTKEIRNVFYKDSEGKIFIKLGVDKKAYLTSKPL